MTGPGTMKVERWTTASIASVAIVVAGVVLLAFGPLMFGANTVDKLTTLFIYVIMAAMWNALASPLNEIARASEITWPP